jgi:predicted  nucleic acid-binding Zn-ribbon protein
MEKHPIHTLIELVEFDQGLRSVDLELQKNKDAIELLRLKEREADKLADSAKQVFREAQKKVDGCELLSKELEQSASEKKKILETVTMPRAQRSAQTEIDHVHQEQERNERIMIAAWDGLERARVALKKQELVVKKQHDKVADQVAELEVVATQLRSKHEQRKENRPELVKQVPEEWLAKYTSMSNQVSNPVVPMEGNACGACFFMLSPRDRIAVLQAQSVRQCGQCFRFLYDGSLLHPDKPEGEVNAELVAGQEVSPEGQPEGE